MRGIASLTAAQLLVLLMGAGKPGDNYFVDFTAYIGLNILRFFSLGMISGSFSNCCLGYVLLNNNYKCY